MNGRDECTFCGAGRFRWNTPDGHQSFCAAVKAAWARRDELVPVVPCTECPPGRRRRGMCERHYVRWLAAEQRARNAVT